MRSGCVRRTWARLFSGVAAAASAAVADAQPDLANLQEIGSGWSAPLFGVSPPGDRSRFFVVQQGGRIRLVLNGVLQTTDFLNVSTLLAPSPGTVSLTGCFDTDCNSSTPCTTATQSFTLVRGGEQGLLGLAFAPDYETSGVFYINYVGPRGNYSPSNTCPASATAVDNGRTVIARYQRSAANPNVADPTGTIILTVDQPFSNHNGGGMHFGPDGMLYIGMGDGGSGNDPGNRALNPNERLGKMLRIDPTRDDFPGDATRNYGIPADNPYAGGGGAAEVWARGLRNPWRWSFDRLTGDLWIADVGQGEIEEVNSVPGNGGPGRNYGWRVREGNRVTGLSAGGFDVSNLTGPVFTYPHSGGTINGISVTGGYVYRGRAIASWRGRYFFADYGTARPWSFRLVNGVAVDFIDHATMLGNLSPGISQVTSFGEDASGELYIIQGGGRVRKIVPQAPIPCVADVDDGTSLGRPDRGVTIDDLLFYLSLYGDGDIRADVDDGTGTGTYDDGVTTDDLLYYLDRYAAGC